MDDKLQLELETVEKIINTVTEFLVNYSFKYWAPLSS
jgi:hypothetical protein